ncbi:Cupin_5 domain-containing protein [Psidium guajava]|nr:Cupin_5 domain-containing protein [Psidium guajava]
MASPTCSEIISRLNLGGHPDGGHYLQTLRDSSIVLSKSHLPSRYKVDRPVSSSIYFLLPSGSVSLLHRVPCAETFHFYLGEPLTVFDLNEDGNFKLTCVGSDLLGENQQLQYTVPPYVWFCAFPTNDYTISTDGAVKVHKAEPRDAENHYSLLGVTCAPAFEFKDSEVAKRAEFVSLFPHLEPLISLLTLPD